MIPTDKQKKEISGYIRKWRSRLYLEEWDFTTHYLHEDHGEATAEVVMRTDYKQASITLNPKFWEADAQHREMILAHELCHLIVQPLVQLACDAGNGCAVSAREIDHWKEAVTQHVTNAVYWANKS